MVAGTRGWTSSIRTLSGLAFAVLLAPLVAIVWASFFANKIITFPPQGYSLSWYANAWATAAFRDGFVLSLELALAATVLSLLLGVPASLALARDRIPGREAIQSVLMAPLIVPGIVAGAAVYMAFIEVESATEIPLSGTFPGLLLAHVLIALPWTVRLVTASLLGMDGAVEEAARSLGAGAFTIFRRVTLPTIRPGIVAGAMFSFVVSFVDLEKSLFLVGPGRTTLPIQIISYLEWSLDPTIAAVATIQIAIISLALVVSDRVFNLTRVF